MKQTKRYRWLFLAVAMLMTLMLAACDHVHNPVIGGDWHVQRGYSDPYTLIDKGDVVFSRFTPTEEDPDPYGYAVYDSQDGSRIGALIPPKDGTYHYEDEADPAFLNKDIDGDGVYEFAICFKDGRIVWFGFAGVPEDAHDLASSNPFVCLGLGDASGPRNPPETTEDPTELTEETEPSTQQAINLEGNWYFNGTDERFLVFGDGTYTIFNRDGSEAESGSWDAEFSDSDTPELTEIELDASMNTLYPVEGVPAFLEDTLGKFNAYVREDLLETEAARQVMQTVEVLNRKYATRQEDLEYPTFRTLRFQPGYFLVDRIERKPDSNYGSNEYSGQWTVTADGQLTLIFLDDDHRETGRETFSLSDIDQSLEMMGKTFYRDPDYPSEPDF